MKLESLWDAFTGALPAQMKNDELLMAKITKAYDLAGPNRLLLMGDFNVKEINWVENEAEGSINSQAFKFYECIKDCFLHQHVLVPTRFRGDQRSTLDLIFTKEEEDVKNIEVIQPLGKSDHGIVVFDFICEWKPNSIFIPRRMYHKGDYVKMAKLLNEVDWETEFEGKCIQQKWNYFKAKLEEISDLCIPLTKP